MVHRDLTIKEVANHMSMKGCLPYAMSPQRAVSRKKAASTQLTFKNRNLYSDSWHCGYNMPMSEMPQAPPSRRRQLMCQSGTSGKCHSKTRAGRYDALTSSLTSVSDPFTPKRNKSGIQSTRILCPSRTATYNDASQQPSSRFSQHGHTLKKKKKHFNLLAESRRQYQAEYMLFNFGKCANNLIAFNDMAIPESKYTQSKQPGKPAAVRSPSPPLRNCSNIKTQQKQQYDRCDMQKRQQFWIGKQSRSMPPQPEVILIPTGSKAEDELRKISSKSGMKMLNRVSCSASDHSIVTLTENSQQQVKCPAASQKPCLEDFDANIYEELANELEIPINHEALNRLLQPINRPAQCHPILSTEPITTSKAASKQRQLNLSELFHENKLKDIEPNTILHSLMQLVAQMCTNDAPKSKQATDPQLADGARLSAGSGTQKQYSIYLVVTSDEEDEDENVSKNNAPATQEPLRLPQCNANANVNMDTINSNKTVTWDDNIQSIYGMPTEPEYVQHFPASYQPDWYDSKPPKRKTKRRTCHGAFRPFDPSRPKKFRAPLHWPKPDYSQSKKNVQRPKSVYGSYRKQQNYHKFGAHGRPLWTQQNKLELSIHNKALWSSHNLTDALYRRLRSSLPPYA